MDLTFSREMAVTHKEFFRLLPAAVKHLTCKISGNIIDIMDGGKTVMIELENETSRTIASLSLPVTNVSIRFTGYSDRDARDFLKQFDRAYQKGGG